MCGLKNAITVSLVDYYKKAGANQITIYLNLSLPIIMTANKLALTISGLTSSLFKYSVIQKSDNLSKVTIELAYSSDIQGKQLGISYS